MFCVPNRERLRLSGGDDEEKQDIIDTKTGRTDKRSNKKMTMMMTIKTNEMSFFFWQRGKKLSEKIYRKQSVTNGCRMPAITTTPKNIHTKKTVNSKIEMRNSRQARLSITTKEP